MESKTIDKKKLIIAIATVAVIAIVAIVLVLLSKGGIRATTMRLLRMEGTVTLEENGKSKTVLDNLRLKSGNAINTEGASLASIGLDETKIVTLDELSRAEFSQKGKKLDLNLTRGSLFFEVKKPLEDDESFDIRTSTMVVGIRGTSGYVTVDSDGNWNIVVTDGKVHVTGTNPNTGEVKEIDVEAGQRCTVYLYDRDKDSVMFTLDEVTEDEIPDFVVTILREEPELLEKVVSDTNWSKPVILGIEEVEKKPVTEEETEEESDAVSDNDKDKTENETLTEAAEQDNVRETTPTSSAKERVQPFIASEADGKIILADGTIFDPEYYAKMNPDVVALLGNDRYVLLEHYLLKGRAENRDASEDERLAKEAAFKAFAAALAEDEEETSSDSSSGSSGSPVGITAVITAGGHLALSANSNSIADVSTMNGNPSIYFSSSGTQEDVDLTLPLTVPENPGSSVYQDAFTLTSVKEIDWANCSYTNDHSVRVSDGTNVVEAIPDNSAAGFAFTVNGSDTYTNAQGQATTISSWRDVADAVSLL